MLSAPKGAVHDTGQNIIQCFVIEGVVRSLSIWAVTMSPSIYPATLLFRTF